nr:hypothetical protein [Tanacetum cinerariifolium]
KIKKEAFQDAIFSMGDNKALGLDGNSATFFKEAWDVIVVDVTKPIKKFVTNGVLLKELNHTIIALIPKVTTSMRYNDYRLVSLNQSAFVPRIRISNYILLTQELIHNYHFDRGTPRCAFKVDIQKSYDTVDCNFLHDVLVIFEFHSRMIRWIIECITSTSLSLSTNGSLHSYFKGKRRMRQGDPMSLYLFTLVMEVLTLILNRRARNSNCLTYHQYCFKLNIINLCFADDLFLFAHGDVNSAQVIMDTLEEFKNASGLTPSLPKSTGYFCNVLNYVKLDILNILPFKEGELCKGKAKVPWEDVCLPKKEGGLDLSSIVYFLIMLANMRPARSVIVKLVFAASCYFIWQERNNRIFIKKTRSQDQVIDIIMSIVRLKLVTCTFKKTTSVQMLVHLWKLPTSLIGPSRN